MSDENQNQRQLQQINITQILKEQKAIRYNIMDYKMTKIINNWRLVGWRCRALINTV